MNKAIILEAYLELSITKETRLILEVIGLFLNQNVLWIGG